MLGGASGAVVGKNQSDAAGRDGTSLQGGDYPQKLYGGMPKIFGNGGGGHLGFFQDGIERSLV